MLESLRTKKMWFCAVATDTINILYVKGQEHMAMKITCSKHFPWKIPQLKKPAMIYVSFIHKLLLFL
jgi:hypothetical protein